jgi:glycosyltransferase involved in cell wall biosynthesis
MDETVKSKPLVSIMMTSYNCAGLIGDAIKSVLAQSYPHWELIILDDASTDDTATVVSDFARSDSRILYSPTPQNLGITKNRNRGFDIVKGKYIAILDSDDFWLDKNKLERQVEFLEENPKYSLIGTNAVVVDINSDKITEFKYETEDKKIKQKMLLRNQFTHSSIVWRRDAVEDTKPYDESLFIWEDYDLILRLGLVGKMSNLPEMMVAYRKHNNNISRKKKFRGALTHLSIIKRYRGHYPNYLLATLKGWLRLLR